MASFYAVEIRHLTSEVNGFVFFSCIFVSFGSELVPKKHQNGNPKKCWFCLFSCAAFVSAWFCVKFHHYFLLFASEGLGFGW